VTELYLGGGEGPGAAVEYIAARWEKTGHPGGPDRASAEARQPGLAREVVEELMAKQK